MSHQGEVALAVARRLLLYAVGIVLLLAFLKAALFVLLITLVSVILALALNAPVTWLADRGAPRVFATILVQLAVLALVAAVAWLVLPPLIDEAAAFAGQLPDYGNMVLQRAAQILEVDPQELREAIGDPDTLQEALPGLGTLVGRVGTYSLTVLTGLIVLISIVAMTTYAVASPHVLLRGYFRLFPAGLQDQAVYAWRRAGQMVTAWVWSNIVVGGVEALAVAVALPLIGVPNALIWATLAFFAELVPKLGGYLMSIPPILVALAQSPTTGLVTLAFYVVLLQITSNVIDPAVRGSVMNLHPAVLLFAVLAMAAAFGFVGALIATPVAGIVASFVEAFYLPRQRGRVLDPDVERMVHASLTHRFVTVPPERQPQFASPGSRSPGSRLRSEGQS